MIKKVKKGFTLIELVVVIAVIAILSAVSVVAYVGITNNAKKSALEQENTTIKTLFKSELAANSYTVTRTYTGYFEKKDDAKLEERLDYTYTFSFDAQSDTISYKLVSGELVNEYYTIPSKNGQSNLTTKSHPLVTDSDHTKLANALEELIWVAQGNKLDQSKFGEDNYNVMLAVDKISSKVHEVQIDFTHNKLVFAHTNGLSADICSFKAAA